MIINPCFLAYGRINLAENFTQPVDYFNWSEDVKKVSLTAPVPECLDPNISLIIIGGGGIVHHHTENTWLKLAQIAERAPATIPVVVWGMGINDHGRFDRAYNPILTTLQKHTNVLVGLRDRFCSNYVPCISCLRPEFDDIYELERHIGVYSHHAYPIESAFPTMSNRVRGTPTADFKRVIRFLGSSDIVVTNTYHGAYWATLLGKKVIVVAPFSNKFFGFCHEPVIVQSMSWLQEGITAATTYPEALSHCRKANIAFHQRVTTFRTLVTGRASTA